MHEMSLIESVVEIACETAAKHDAKSIKSIRLDVGSLTYVDPDALLFCYDAAKRGSLAENALLEINRIAGQGWCPDCGKTVPLEQRFEACPECGQYHVKVTAGEELKIRDLEVI
jgi:hydrogenase nickel incorporation protein HypA/HybF